MSGVSEIVNPVTVGEQSEIKTLGNATVCQEDCPVIACLYYSIS